MVLPDDFMSEVLRAKTVRKQKIRRHSRPVGETVSVPRGERQKTFELWKQNTERVAPIFQTNIILAKIQNARDLLAEERFERLRKK